MTTDDQLAQRIRAALNNLPGLVEKKMFGGIGFLVLGNMACGVNKGNLIVRVGADEYAAALAQPYARPFDLTGKPMAGWVFVDPPGMEAEDDLRRWVEQGVAFALTLPPK